MQNPNQNDPAERVFMLALILFVFLALAYFTPRIVNTLETKLDQTVNQISE